MLLETVVDNCSDLLLKTLAKVLEEGGTTGKNNVRIELTTAINWRLLNSSIDEDLEWSGVFAGEDFRVEEDFWSKEAFISNVDCERLLMQEMMTLKKRKSQKPS